MNPIAMVGRAVVCALVMVGTAVAFGCSSAEPSNDVQNVGTVTIPLSTTVGTSNYRLDAAFTITGEQRVMTLTTR